MERAIETIKKGGLVAKLYPDDDASNSRKDFDQGCKMVCWHSRYNLGDEQPKVDPEDWLRQFAFCDLAGKGDVPDIPYEELDRHSERILRKHAVILPLFLYDHSGITIRCEPFSCPWDSGQVGWAYMTKDEVIKEYGEWSDESRDKAEKLIRCEVEVYDQFLTGDVYGYQIEDETGEEIDSCWGFFGYDYALEEMNQALDDCVNRRARKAHDDVMREAIESSKVERMMRL